MPIKHPVSRDWVIKTTTKARLAGTVANLSGIDFTGTSWSGVDFSTEGRDGSFGTKLLGTDFRSANLANANFFEVDLACANLRAANLSGANLAGANLYGALLGGAKLQNCDLSRANLYKAELNGAQLHFTNFQAARFGETDIAGIDLTRAVGIDQLFHIAPSLVDITALDLTTRALTHAPAAAQLAVFRFLAAAGLPDDLLAVLRTWTSKPIQFHSVFLSHSTADKEFSSRLYNDLHLHGVNCWYDEHNILPGDSILESVDQGIRLWNKLVFIASANSLAANTGWWVEQELERALSKERELRKRTSARESLVIPLAIDDAVFDECQSPYVATLLERKIADFRDWQDPTSYNRALDSLLTALAPRSQDSQEPGHRQDDL